MCGIAGWVNWRGIKDDQRIIVEMTESLAHRGPDAMETVDTSHAHLGHRRLAVIDLEGGRQPMQRTVGEQTYTIIYNGELYNTDTLRKQLEQKGYHFSTQSDTEVLLVSYIEWQEHCVDYIEGIFAFAVWCEEQRQLFLCRDRLGVKPLFYVQQDDAIYFASELKALLKHPAIKAEVDMKGLRGLLSIGPSRNPGETVYRQIKELKQAHFMVATPTSNRIQSYWKPVTKPHNLSLEETVEQLRLMIVQAVEKQLVSDVPLCTFLSGGIDSSIITAIAAQYYAKTGQVLHTYSVDYEGNDQFFKQNDYQVARDQYYIDLMQKQAQTKHHSIIIQQQDLADTLVEAMCLKDYPSMADIDSSLYLFCREVKKDFTVALSGECADELFGGYPWFFKDQIYFPWIRSIREREALLQLHWREQLQLEAYLKESYEKAIAEVKEDKQQQLFYLNRHYFMQTLLERKDRMSMGTGLEVRVPFADHHLVDFAWNIPWEMKSVDGYEKGILRRAVEGLVPHEILYRKKNPYPKTHHPVYEQIVKQMLQDCLQDRSSILHTLFDATMMQKLLDTDGEAFKEPWFGQLMNGPQLFAYFVQLHEWVKRYNVSFV